DVVAVSVHPAGDAAGHVVAYVIVGPAEPESIPGGARIVNAQAGAVDSHNEVVGDDVVGLRTGFGDETGAGPVVQDVVLDQAVAAVVDVDAPDVGHRRQRAAN